MNDISRGAEAAQVLHNTIYKEAFEQIEKNVIAQIASADTSDEAAAKLRNLLIAMRRFKTYMEQVMVTGKYAEQELVRKSLLDKAREGLRRVY